MDAAEGPAARIASADMEEEPDGVGFPVGLGQIMGERAFEVAGETLRPVAFLAGILGRAQIGDGGGNGPLVMAGDDAPELFGSVGL